VKRLIKRDKEVFGEVIVGKLTLAMKFKGTSVKSSTTPS
jgi:hypothetical protein